MSRFRPHDPETVLPAEVEPRPVLLRDGTSATLYVANRTHQTALLDFFARLSPAARRRRFFLEVAPPDELVRDMCDASNPSHQLTLFVARQGERLSILAVGSYAAKDERTVEVAFAVDDEYHGMGLGTLLLERLAFAAHDAGFTRLWAVTQPDNLAMREVFHESGFEMREWFAGDEMEVELLIRPLGSEPTRTDLRERIATVASLKPLFRPQHLAVIGASRDPSRLGAKLLDALLSAGFRGNLYPVNPSTSSIRGLASYPSITEVPARVDVAVIAVPAERALQVVDECGTANVRTLVVITAGFAETGTEGARLQQTLAQKTRDYGMRMVGPNCFGVVNTDDSIRLNATFSSTFPPAGRVAMSSQSGALGLAVLAAAHRLQVGISTFVSVGNKADVSVNDLLQYWEEDRASDVILLYVESFGNPRRFSRIARRVSRRKPIVTVKAGRTSSGRRAAGSHTASLAASDTAVDALFQQTGVIRADTLEDMFALAAGLSNQPLPSGRRVAILTNAGGPGILCADTCEANGLLVPELSSATSRQLAAFTPAAASLKNPVDLIASATPDQYRQAIATLMESQELDALIILFIAVSPQDTAPISEGILEGIRQARSAGIVSKPVMITWMAEGDLDRRFSTAGEVIPTFNLPETPGLVLSKAACYAEWRREPVGQVSLHSDIDLQLVRDICTRALRKEASGWLSADDTRAVLAAMRLPLPTGGVAETEDKAVELAEQVGFPVAVKLASRTIVHKTEVGGVRLPLRNSEDVRQAYRDIREQLQRRNQLDAMDGVVIQPMLSGGVEVMVGATHDPSFGPLVAFGLGGIHVEILQDVQFRVTPLTDRDAHAMVRAIRGYRLLEGYRGHAPADISAIEDVLLRVSTLVEEVAEITELDLNPVFAFPPGQGCRIVDARIRIASRSP
ncbi:MAG: GNAT family N-acetyltransferase [Nitrospiraceae bacterium]